MKKTIISIAAAIVMGAAAVLTGIATDVSDGIAIAMDTDRAKEVCVKLLDGEIPE